MRQLEPLEGNSDTESNASDVSNDSNDSNSLSVKTSDDSEDDNGRNFGLELIVLKRSRSIFI